MGGVMKRSKPSVLQCLIVLCTLWIGACGGGGGNGTTTAPAVSVLVTPASSTVQAGTTTTLSATVSHDPSGQGVTWTVSCAAAPCGSVSPTTTASGAATTYIAPPSPPAAGCGGHYPDPVAVCQICKGAVNGKIAFGPSARGSNRGR